MTGILIVDKPAGWTSQDVTAKLRGVFRERRVGHGGTLDPMATGVLPVFFGRATRAVPFFEAAEKEYIAEIRFGLRTDTQDITGNVLEECPAAVTEKAFRAALSSMLGPQMQTPPMYSAVKVGGKKLYELARKGQEVARIPRPIELRELEMLSFHRDRASFRVLCSKGTYIRTVCDDLGRRLGCGGCMSALRRTKAGCYGIEAAATMETILAGDAELLPVDSLFAACPAVTLTREEARLCRNGNAFPRPDLRDGDYRAYGPEGEFLMLGRCSSGTLATLKSFFEVDHG